MVNALAIESRLPVDSEAAESVVISSRIRIARNVAGYAFPGWSGRRESQRLYELLSNTLCQLPCLHSPVAIAMDTVASGERELLCERHLISPELAGKHHACGLVLADGDQVSVMINEEDHLRIQVMRPSLDLLSAWSAIHAIDKALESRLEYAFSERYGFLTACPSNVGTGLRAGVMMHLPGLRLMNEMDQVVKGLNRMGLAVRGAFGEGSDASGNLYQISNQMTLGVEEQDVINRLVALARYLIQVELHARQRLREQRLLHVLDHCARACAILAHARILASGEAMDVLSALQLGVAYGFVQGISGSQLNALMIEVQPAHLQQAVGTNLDAESRDQMRAAMLRKAVKNVRLTE